MPVELGKVREFARATGSDNPAYLEEASPVIPATYLMAAAFWTQPGASLFESLGLDNRRLLHGGQSFEFTGEPPRAGTTLTGRAVIEDVYEKTGSRGGRMTFYVTRTDFQDGRGEIVAVARTTAIITESPAVS